MDSMGRGHFRPTTARSAESYELLNYIHGIVPVRHLHKMQGEVARRGVATTGQTSDVAWETSKTHRKDLNNRGQTTTLINMHTMYGLRKSAMIPAALSLAPSTLLDAPSTLLAAPSKLRAAPSLVTSVTDSLLETKPAPFFDHDFDTTTQVFTTAIRAAHTSEIATKAVILESMGFKQFTTPAAAPATSSSIAEIPVRHETPLWPLWLLLPLIVVLTSFAALIYLKLIARPIALRRKQTVGSQDYRDGDAEDIRREGRGPRASAILSGNQLHRRSIQPIHGCETVQELGLPQGGLATMHSHSQIPNGQFGSHRYGAADAHLDQFRDFGLDRAAGTLYSGPCHASHMVSSMQRGISPKVEQHYSYDQREYVSSRPDGATTLPLQSERWPSRGLVAEGCGSGMVGIDHGGPVTPSYASGNSLVSPKPAYWHHRQDPSTYASPVHTFIHDKAVVESQRFSHSELRQRKQRVPQLRVDTTLANGGYYANYSTNFDVESQVEESEPQPVASQSRPWLSLPTLDHGNNKESSSNASRTHSRSSSTSSFLTDLVDGFARKIADFTNDSGGPEDGLLLPIRARDRREADALGGEL